SALVALGAAVGYQPDGWLWTVTFAVLAVSYLAAQALAARRERAWAGEAAAILAASAASGPLGVRGGHFVLPFVVAVPLIVLRRHDSLFFYGALVVVVANLGGAVVATGHWEIVAALAISAVGFGAAAEFGAVRYSPIAARGLFSLAWFGGVDAAGAQGWRGPFDALLALVYVIASQV